MSKRQDLHNRMISCKLQLSNLMSKIDVTILEIAEKKHNVDKSVWVSEIKMIREEITKVTHEIDSIKKEINLLSGYQIN